MEGCMATVLREKREVMPDQRRRAGVDSGKINGVLTSDEDAALTEIHRALDTETIQHALDECETAYTPAFAPP